MYRLYKNTCYNWHNTQTYGWQKSIRRSEKKNIWTFSLSCYNKDGEVFWNYEPHCYE